MGQRRKGGTALDDDHERVRIAGKSLLIDLQVQELDDFMAAMRPEGIFLSLAVEPELQPDVLKRIAKW